MAYLMRTDLTRANMNSANPAYTEMTETKLVGPSLTSTKVPHFDLTRSNLTGADLSVADMNVIRFVGAILKDVNLDLVNLVS
jgi:uncharacterized protein YjbI with pentapeptide repeats